jgi:hypothetical protein
LNVKLSALTPQTAVSSPLLSVQKAGPESTREGPIVLSRTSGAATPELLFVSPTLLSISQLDCSEGIHKRTLRIAHKPLNVATLMNGFAVFVGGKIETKIHRLAANYAGYF